MGAASTDYTKPWLAEIQVTDQPLPHPTLRHEIVHAVASALSPGPLHLPARGRILPSLALVEGLAVALETPRGGATVTEWSRAARDLGELPDLARLLGPAGFWGQPPARAYTAAGSFLAELLTRYGPAPIAAAYRDGDLPAAYHRPLHELLAEWQRSLDELPPSPGPIGRGGGAVRAGEPLREALRTASRRRSCALRTAPPGPGEPPRRASSMRRRRSSAAPQMPSFERPTCSPLPASWMSPRRATLPPNRPSRPRTSRVERRCGAQGDLAWRRGELEEALSDWEEARARPRRPRRCASSPSRPSPRADPELGPAVRDYLLGPAIPWRSPGVTRTGEPLSDYLVGRALSWGASGPRPRGARPRGHRRRPAPPISLEARLCLAEAGWRTPPMPGFWRQARARRRRRPGAPRRDPAGAVPSRRPGVRARPHPRGARAKKEALPDAEPVDDRRRVLHAVSKKPQVQPRSRPCASTPRYPWERRRPVGAGKDLNPHPQCRVPLQHELEELHPVRSHLLASERGNPSSRTGRQGEGEVRIAPLPQQKRRGPPLHGEPGRPLGKEQVHAGVAGERPSRLARSRGMLQKFLQGLEGSIGHAPTLRRRPLRGAPPRVARCLPVDRTGHAGESRPHEVEIPRPAPRPGPRLRPAPPPQLGHPRRRGYPGHRHPPRDLPAGDGSPGPPGGDGARSRPPTSTTGGPTTPPTRWTGPASRRASRSSPRSPRSGSSSSLRRVDVKGDKAGRRGLSSTSGTKTDPQPHPSRATTPTCTRWTCSKLHGTWKFESGL